MSILDIAKPKLSDKELADICLKLKQCIIYLKALRELKISQELMENPVPLEKVDEEIINVCCWIKQTMNEHMEIWMKNGINFILKKSTLTFDQVQGLRNPDIPDLSNIKKILKDGGYYWITPTLDGYYPNGRLSISSAKIKAGKYDTFEDFLNARGIIITKKIYNPTPIQSYVHIKYEVHS